MNDKALVKACEKGNTSAMKALYERFYAIMLGACRRYVHNNADAEDFVQEGFIKVFRDIGSFKGTGSLEGWIRRVMVNHVLMQLRQKGREIAVDDFESYAMFDENEDNTEAYTREEQIRKVEFSEEELISMIQELPTGYRQVLNMYVIDHFKHQEIAKMLKISEGTSKSQLNRARKLMKQKLLDMALRKGRM